MASFADSSGSGLAIALAGSQDYRILRTTGWDLNDNRTDATPGEIRSDGQVLAGAHVEGSAGGSIKFQLSYKEQDEFLLGAFRQTSYTSIDVTKSLTISAGANATITGSASDFTGLGPENWIRLKDAPDSGDDGLHLVTDVNGDGSVITTASTLVGGTGSCTVQCDTISNGSATPEYDLEELLSTGNYFTYTTCQVGTLGLEMSPGGYIEGTVQISGTGAGDSNTSDDSDTYTASNPHDVMSVVSGIRYLSMQQLNTNGTHGAAISASINSINLQFENGLRDQRVVDSIYPAGIGRSRFVPTMSVGMYFQNRDFFGHFQNYDAITTRIGFTDGAIGSDAGNFYMLSLPNCRIGSFAASPEGPDTDITPQVEMRAYMDTILTQKTAILSRIPAAS